MGRDLPPDLEIEHNWEKYYELQLGDIFVEIGGFWGRYTSYASKRCGQVIVVEPNPFNREKLVERSQSEQLANITIIPNAVSDHKGEAIFLDAGNPAGTRLAEQGEDTSSMTQITVQVDTLEGLLDSLPIDHVDLLASDCENCEIKLVQYAGRWIREHRIKHWAIGAYHRPENPPEISRILNAYGYDCRYEEAVIYAQ
jgi:FkbM family methyltransferase